MIMNFFLEIGKETEAWAAKKGTEVVLHERL